MKNDTRNIRFFAQTQPIRQAKIICREISLPFEMIYKYRLNKIIDYDNNIYAKNKTVFVAQLMNIHKFITKYIDEYAEMHERNEDVDESYICGLDNEIYYPKEDRFFIKINNHKKREKMIKILKKKFKKNVSVKGDYQLIEVILPIKYCTTN